MDNQDPQLSLVPGMFVISDYILRGFIDMGSRIVDFAYVSMSLHNLTCLVI